MIEGAVFGRALYLRSVVRRCAHIVVMAYCLHGGVTRAQSDVPYVLDSLPSYTVAEDPGDVRVIDLRPARPTSADRAETRRLRRNTGLRDGQLPAELRFWERMDDVLSDVALILVEVALFR